jgi:hypothetical protein
MARAPPALAEQSRDRGPLALQENTELVRRLEDEHAQHAEADQRRLVRRARFERAIQITLALLAIAAGGVIAALTR